MTWKKWDFEVGKEYALAYVVAVCDARIREGGVIRIDAKGAKVRRMEKYAPPNVVWSPSNERGWGASPFNKNCWRTVEGGTIIPSEVAKSEENVGGALSSPEER